jgi:F-type H+-transporting ATPase subunit c
MEASTVLSNLAICAPLTVGLASIGPGIGIGLMTAGYFNASARQPELRGPLFTVWIITLGVVELLGLFGLITFFLIFQKAGV